jgi:hypothetical protein
MAAALVVLRLPLLGAEAPVAYIPEVVAVTCSIHVAQSGAASRLFDTLQVVQALNRMNGALKLTNC